MNGETVPFFISECTSDFSNLLTQNEILKSSLDQLANEKAGLVHQLRMTQDQLAKEKAGLVHQLRAAQDQLAMRDQQESQAAANFKVGWSTLGSSFTVIYRNLEFI